MKVQATEIANQEVDALDAETRSSVLKAIWERLPDSVSHDPTVRIEEAGADVRIHRVGEVRILYRVFDVDNDGEDEIVILNLISHEEIPRGTTPTSPDAAVGGTAPSTSARIGHELLSKIEDEG